MALLWLRVYPTYEVLGYFFGLHKRNAQLDVRAALAALDTLDDFPFDRPGPDRPKARSAAEVMVAFPQVQVIIDAKEQCINKPAGEEAQKPYYSKKKAHTVKPQVVIDTRGRIVTISGSVPGSMHDLPLLIGSGVMEGLGGATAMMDKGYVARLKSSAAAGSTPASATARRFDPTQEPAGSREGNPVKRSTA
jgi:hypothetical protein